jgi:hypothetical protein
MVYSNGSAIATRGAEAVVDSAGSPIAGLRRPHDLSGPALRLDSGSSSGAGRKDGAAFPVSRHGCGEKSQRLL